MMILLKGPSEGTGRLAKLGRPEHSSHCWYHAHLWRLTSYRITLDV
jgi:hypothetical protein